MVATFELPSADAHEHAASFVLLGKYQVAYACARRMALVNAACHTDEARELSHTRCEPHQV